MIEQKYKSKIIIKFLENINDFVWTIIIVYENNVFAFHSLVDYNILDNNKKKYNNKFKELYNLIKNLLRKIYTNNNVLKDFNEKSGEGIYQNSKIDNITKSINLYDAENEEEIIKKYSNFSFKKEFNSFCDNYSAKKDSFDYDSNYDKYENFDGNLQENFDKDFSSLNFEKAGNIFEEHKIKCSFYFEKCYKKDENISKIASKIINEILESYPLKINNAINLNKKSSSQTKSLIIIFGKYKQDKSEINKSINSSLNNSFDLNLSSIDIIEDNFSFSQESILFSDKNGKKNIYYDNELLFGLNINLIGTFSLSKSALLNMIIEPIKIYKISINSLYFEHTNIYYDLIYAFCNREKSLNLSIEKKIKYIYSHKQS